jgi:hypothetical protein
MTPEGRMIGVANAQRIVEAHDAFVELTIRMRDAPAPPDHRTYLIIVSVSIDCQHVKVEAHAQILPAQPPGVQPHRPASSPMRDHRATRHPRIAARSAQRGRSGSEDRDDRMRRDVRGLLDGDA